MNEFEISEPSSLSEALALLDAGDEATRPVGGGTALMLMMKAGVFRPSRLISLRRLRGTLSSIEQIANGGARIGALCTLANLEKSDFLNSRFPVLRRALRHLSNVRVRNIATIGGAVAHGDPHMDLPPILLALNAAVEVSGCSHQRSLPIRDLFSGYYETTLVRGELITAITIPPQPGLRASYVKVTTRAAHDWPIMGIAVALTMSALKITAAKVVVSAATDRPQHLEAAEKILLEAGTFDQSVAGAIVKAVDRSVELLSNSHGSADYKAHLLSVYLPDAIERAVHSGAGEVRLS